MTFDDPEDDDSTDSAAFDVDAEPTVDVEWDDEPMPLTDAVQLHNDFLANPNSFGLVGEDVFHQAIQDLTDRVNTLENENDELRDLLDDLELTVEVLAAESDVMNAECPECGDRLETTGVGDKRVECDGCDRTIRV